MEPEPRLRRGFTNGMPGPAGIQRRMELSAGQGLVIRPPSGVGVPRVTWLPPAPILLRMPCERFRTLLRGALGTFGPRRRPRTCVPRPPTGPRAYGVLYVR